MERGTTDELPVLWEEEEVLQRQEAPPQEERPGPRHRKKIGQRRTSGMYWIIVTIWAVLCVPMILAVRPVTDAAFRRGDWLGAAVIATTAFIAYFWLNGVKDVVYPIAYRVTGWRRKLVPKRQSTSQPRVGLLYVTCNDFSEDSLAASLTQDYANCRAVILDDSSKPEYIARVDEFARMRGIPVVRRADRAGFKAGNLNHYLRSDDALDLDYFVIIDSDEVLPPEFITRALDYFEDTDIGIVQANHVATRNRTAFMKMFAPGVDAHWPAYQVVKSHAGFLSLLGHGAMVSMTAYRAANGFPSVVAEDIGFTIDAMINGYRATFAPDILCEEEFPPDYAAFRKRHNKWTEGNMEFIRTYNRRILFSRQLRWHEKLDIILFTYGLPLTSVFSAYVVMNAILFPLLGFSNRYSLWMLIPTVTFLFAPMMNDVITWRRAPKGKLLSYLLHSMALFGSMYFVSLFASVRTTFGGSVFHVTPKLSGRVSFPEAARQNKAVLLAGAVLAAVVELASGSILPVVLILLPAVFGLYLSVMNAGDHLSDDTSTGHILQDFEEDKEGIS